MRTARASDVVGDIAVSRRDSVAFAVELEEFAKDMTPRLPQR
ncbi:hypothetical protein [Salinibacterium amurskyense]|nr:hypothetical protein [Salinibacterium amurskyense]